MKPHKCPKCDGVGKLCYDPNNPVMTGSYLWNCNACVNGIILVPEFPPKEIDFQELPKPLPYEYVVPKDADEFMRVNWETRKKAISNSQYTYCMPYSFYPSITIF